MIMSHGGAIRKGLMVTLKKEFTTGIPTHLSVLGAPDISGSEITHAEMVTEGNVNAISGKLGWAALGGVALGPLGLLAGAVAGGRRRRMIIAMRTADGRHFLLEGPYEEASELLTATAESANARKDARRLDDEAATQSMV